MQTSRISSARFLSLNAQRNRLEKSDTRSFHPNIISRVCVVRAKTDIALKRYKLYWGMWEENSFLHPHEILAMMTRRVSCDMQPLVQVSCQCSSFPRISLVRRPEHDLRSQTALLPRQFETTLSLVACRSDHISSQAPSKLIYLRNKLS
jgi:hypothetical protein